MEENKKYFCV